MEGKRLLEAAKAKGMSIEYAPNAGEYMLIFR